MRWKLPEPRVRSLHGPRTIAKSGTYLVEFAESRIRDADAFNEKYDLNNYPQSEEGMSDEERDSRFLGPDYRPARNALLLAESLDAKSPKIQRLLARTELVLAKTPAHYSAAHERLARVIESILSDQTTDADELTSSMTAGRCGAKLHSAGPNRSERLRAVSEETLKRMREAVDDLTTALNTSIICRSSIPTKTRNVKTRLRNANIIITCTTA